MLTTYSGDVTIELPTDATLRVNDRVGASGEIIIEFPVKFPGGTAEGGRGPESASRLSGTVGAGDAELTLSSFSGTVYLRKR